MLTTLFKFCGPVLAACFLLVPACGDDDGDSDDSAGGADGSAGGSGEPRGGEPSAAGGTAATAEGGGASLAGAGGSEEPVAGSGGSTSTNPSGPEAHALFSDYFGVERIDFEADDAVSTVTDQASISQIVVSPDGSKVMTSTSTNAGPVLILDVDGEELGTVDGMPVAWIGDERVLVVEQASIFSLGPIVSYAVDGSDAQTVVDVTGAALAFTRQAISPDQQRLVYLLVDGGDSTLVSVGLDGSDEHTLDISGQAADNFGFVEDGRILYSMINGGDGKLHVAPADLSSESVLNDTLVGVRGFTRWTPGHVLVATQTEGQGSVIISKFYSVDLDSGEESELTAWNDVGGLLIKKMRVSRDGERVYYAKGTDLFVSAVDAPSTTPIASGFGGIQTIDW